MLKKSKPQKCIPITDEERVIINEKFLQNLRDAKITHLPHGIERLEVNLKSYIEANNKLEKEGKCLLWLHPNTISEEILTIIEYVKSRQK